METPFCFPNELARLTKKGSGAGFEMMIETAPDGALRAGSFLNNL